ncbi:acetyl-CoA synthetase-like protein [Rickenella mellea]|uniref:Acetyl-CoA synthetase-like protein n=1 Tax=Rickenella mellea TaxID=50990 RepID=A0A4Y7QL67_9AGAM|nr:acetyl-CoA synthetase-like protein [Rickenella mellea]
MPDLLAIDETSLALGLVLILLFIAGIFLKPDSLVHPILLGRQSDVDKVRKKGESAIYRNYGTGLMGRLPGRPSKEVQVLSDLLKPDFEGARFLWSHEVSNVEILRRVAALGAGLVNVAGLRERESNVLLLLNDGIEFIITDLALASHSIPSFTLTSLTLLTAVLESHPPSAIVLHASFVSQVLELIIENHEFAQHTLIVVGDDGMPKNLDRYRNKVKILRWEDVEGEGSKLGGSASRAPAESKDVFTVSFYEGGDNELKATQFTHENLTAGVASMKFLLPFNAGISPADCIVSAFSLSTPYGRTLAYTALYEGTSFATVKSASLYIVDEGNSRTVSEVLNVMQGNFPTPTILFLTPQHLDFISSSILSQAKKSFLFFLARRHKLAALQAGFISQDSFWDRFGFSSARNMVLRNMDRKIRALIITSGVPAENVTPSRLAISVPLVHAHAHPAVAGPVFASHPQDFQVFPSVTGDRKNEESRFAKNAHVGPPVLNVEVKLIGLDDTSVVGGAKPVGEIVLRGPSVGKPLDEGRILPDGWIRIHESAMVQNNGTFKVQTSNEVLKT